MWKVIKDLYTNVKAQVLYAGSLSRKIDVSQGNNAGQKLWQNLGNPAGLNTILNSLLDLILSWTFSFLLHYLCPPPPPPPQCWRRSTFRDKHFKNNIEIGEGGGGFWNVTLSTQEHIAWCFCQIILSGIEGRILALFMYKVYVNGFYVC